MSDDLFKGTPDEWRWLDTLELLAMATDSSQRGFNRQLDADQLADTAAPDGKHLLKPLLRHRFIKGEPAPEHYRCTLLIKAQHQRPEVGTPRPARLPMPVDGGCTCEKCVSACRTRPGLFAPSEVEKAAAFLGMAVEDFKSKYLVEEYWIGGADSVPMPRLTRHPEGYIRPGWGDPFEKGECVFLANNRCRIHAVKPIECREAFPCRPETTDHLRHRVQLLWLEAEGLRCNCGNCEKGE